MLNFSLFNKKNQKAFSLIEMLLTFLIVAFLIGFSTQYLRKKERKVKDTFEELSRLNQRLISLSHLRSNHYRLVFDLSLEKPDQYWVEKKSKTIKKGGLSDKSSAGFENAALDEDQSNFSKENFEIDKSFYPEPNSFPSFLDIIEIETKKSSKQDGRIFIDYNSSPLAQEMKIQFLRLDNKARWTLFLDPVSKQLKLVE